MGAKFEAIKHATSTGIMWHCENNLEQGSRIQDYLKESPIQKTLIITHGISAKYALAWSESQIETCSVMAVDQFQKIDSALQSELKHYEQIIVFEEQFKRNGLYEFVEELVIEGNMLPIRLLRIGPETLYKRLCFVRESKIREEIADSIDL